MNRKDFDIAATLVERIDKLERTIFGLQEMLNKKSFQIVASDFSIGEIISNLDKKESIVYLNPNEIATEVFVQDILQYYIDTLNLELEELRKSFEEI